MAYRLGGAAMKRLWLPRRFWEDHYERCADHPGHRREIEWKRFRILVELDDEALANLGSDADFYEDPKGFVNTSPALHRSAKMTLHEVKRQCRGAVLP
jgi:hypothetical protein